MTNINNHAYRSLHKFSLNKDSNSNSNSNNLTDQPAVPTPQGTPVKKFLTNQPIIAPADLPQDTMSIQPPQNSNSLYTNPFYQRPAFEPKIRDRSSALNALHQEHPNATPEELQELLRTRLRASFLHF
ncbi:MAG: hypothetical protein WC314_14910 [Vulcanimicrobiota bacterium]